MRALLCHLQLRQIFSPFEILFFSFECLSKRLLDNVTLSSYFVRIATLMRHFVYLSNTCQFLEYLSPEEKTMKKVLFLVLFCFCVARIHAIDGSWIDGNFALLLTASQGLNPQILDPLTVFSLQL